MPVIGLSRISASRKCAIIGSEKVVNTNQPSKGKRYHRYKKVIAILQRIRTGDNLVLRNALSTKMKRTHTAKPKKTMSIPIVDLSKDDRSGFTSTAVIRSANRRLKTIAKMEITMGGIYPLFSSFLLSIRVTYFLERYQILARPAADLTAATFSPTIYRSSPLPHPPQPLIQGPQLPLRQHFPHQPLHRFYILLR
jgi:hypothetical protein